MNKNEYQKMAEFEKNYWWHQGRLSLIDNLIKKFNSAEKPEILEIGCGTGETTEHLSKHGNVIGIDISEDAVEFCRKRDLKNTHLLDINRSADSDILKTKKFDLIFALDVLEHIKNDKKTLNIVNDLLKKDGLFISTVPAHKFLWSEHDESLHHVRRYHKYEISKKIEESGLEIAKMSYFIFTFFPIIFAYRIWGNIFGKSVYPKTSYVPLPDFLNRFFINLLKLEAWLVNYLDLPIGVTIVTVAKKNTD